MYQSIFFREFLSSAKENNNVYNWDSPKGVKSDLQNMIYYLVSIHKNNNTQPLHYTLAQLSNSELIKLSNKSIGNWKET